METVQADKNCDCRSDDFLVLHQVVDSVQVEKAYKESLVEMVNQEDRVEVMK